MGEWVGGGQQYLSYKCILITCRYVPTSKQQFLLAVGSKISLRKISGKVSPDLQLSESDLL